MGTSTLILIGTIKAKQNLIQKVEDILNKSFVEFNQDGPVFDILSYTTAVVDEPNEKANLTAYLVKLKEDLRRCSSGSVSIFSQSECVKWGSKQ